ncbi:hypothetical protein PUN28_006516 [Cardiocondyla obscurior]|uniref:Uncharacterized protein n=1 Tax=Cardiocondyla obscurior TaxID=286306 RepID=A0AAW2GCX6_9HYME
MGREGTDKTKGTTLTLLEKKETSYQGRLYNIEKRRNKKKTKEKKSLAEAVAASLSFGFVRFAPAPREREPRVNLFSDEVDEERD